MRVKSWYSYEEHSWNQPVLSVDILGSAKWVGKWIWQETKFKHLSSITYTRLTHWPFKHLSVFVSQIVKTPRILKLHIFWWISTHCASLIPNNKVLFIAKSIVKASKQQNSNFGGPHKDYFQRYNGRLHATAILHVYWKIWQGEYSKGIVIIVLTSPRPYCFTYRRESGKALYMFQYSIALRSLLL